MRQHLDRFVEGPIPGAMFVAAWVLMLVVVHVNMYIQHRSGLPMQETLTWSQACH